jgi:hypothetical protein
MATKTIIRRRPKVLTPSVSRVESISDISPLAETLTQIAYIFFAVLESLLIARFVLRLAAADPFQSWVAWIYNTTSIFVIPFESIFPSANNDASVLEVSTLVAMIAYLFVFYLAIALFRMFVHQEQVINPDLEGDL